jgi:pyruvate formate lyase activating enzyme
MICEICPHACDIPEGGTGFCGARENRGGEIAPISYGCISSISLDPIEKKPLHRFRPGGMILSIGGFGCNFRCPFCQNHGISMTRPDNARLMSPERIASMAKGFVPRGNIGVAYTYNEPLIHYEFVLACAMAVRAAGLANVLVTNGFIMPKPLSGLLPFVDAFNIDLKAFTEGFYRNIKGRLATVKETIAQAARFCHVEVTTLIIPGENDSADEICGLARFLAGISEDIPLHLSRFFPRHEMTEKPPTPVETIYELKTVAEKYLKYVYAGNV